MILGIDEVGRGPWAGPLVMGAVVLGCEIEGLTDSKKLSAKRREQLAAEIQQKAAAVGLGWVYADEIDMLGLGKALAVACQRAVEQIDTLGVAYQEIILDGTINFLKDTVKGQYVTTLKKADLLIPAVSAASIVAKVARDAYMVEQDEVFPEYGFSSHVGYGTATHIAAIEAHGVTPLHRLSFAPLAKYRNDVTINAARHQSRYALGSIRASAPRRTLATDVLAYESAPSTSKQIGDKAEEVVTEYLQKNGHEILERNWKTKFCEIDIVSKKDDRIYFTEVKYRKNANQGGGIAAITPKKLKQMKFAAEYFALKHTLLEMNLSLAAAEVSGDDFSIASWIEIR